MADQNLGRLESVDVRKIWAREDRNFTPWLARDENLVLLGEALNIDLELEAREKEVGPFRADILCKDTKSGSWVLVENQLEDSDHKHLGQLLTYASGLEAVTIIWIAKHFIEEHRSTLDWLNRITDETFRFFALEVELWRIGDSPVAPKFNIVSKPNNWSRAVAQAARAPNETTLMQQNYWRALLSALRKRSGPITAGNPQKQYMYFTLGKTGFRLRTAMAILGKEIRCELELYGDGKEYFECLYEYKDVVEQELGYSLEWENQISIRLGEVDPKEKSDWPRQHEWLSDKLNDMHRVFAKRIGSFS